MYFKILGEDLTYNGYTYHEGLNIDPNPFDPTPDYGNGLFFADEKEILRFCDYGTKIAEVIIPEGEEIVQVEEKYKAHRIILGEIRNLWTVETFEWLMKYGADIHSKNDYVLRCAVDNYDLDMVKCLVEQGANVHADDDYVLCWAAEEGQLEMVKYLVKRGADVHAQNDYALHCATHYGHLEVVAYLKALD